MTKDVYIVNVQSQAASVAMNRYRGTLSSLKPNQSTHNERNNKKIDASAWNESQRAVGLSSGSAWITTLSPNQFKGGAREEEHGDDAGAASGKVDFPETLQEAIKGSGPSDENPSDPRRVDTIASDGISQQTANPFGQPTLARAKL